MPRWLYRHVTALRRVFVVGAVVCGSCTGVAAAQSTPPSIATDGAHATGATTATVEGNGDPEGQDTTLHADYALASSQWCTSGGAASTPAETAPQSLGSGHVMVSEILVKLEGLTPESEYCTELVATNASGTAYGEQRRFTTSAQSSSSPPSEVVTEPAEATPSGVKLKGKLDPSGLPTTYYFEYSSVTCDELPDCVQRTTTAGPLTGDTQQEVPAVEVTSLTAGNKYSYRLVASNADGTVDGAFVTFTAPPKSEPPTPLVTPPIQTSSPGTPLTPTSPPVETIATRPLTNPQEFARVLKLCAKKPKKQRASCRRRAHKRYGPSGKQASRGRRRSKTG